MPDPMILDLQGDMPEERRACAAGLQELAHWAVRHAIWRHSGRGGGERRAGAVRRHRRHGRGARGTGAGTPARPAPEQARAGGGDRVSRRPATHRHIFSCHRERRGKRLVRAGRRLSRHQLPRRHLHPAGPAGGGGSRGAADQRRRARLGRRLRNRHPVRAGPSRRSRRHSIRTPPIRPSAPRRRSVWRAVCPPNPSGRPSATPRPW